MTARLRSHDGMLLALVVLAQGAVVWHFASRSYFFQDDFVSLFHARTADLTPGWLIGNQIGRFAPGQRLLTFTLWRAVGFDFTAALATLVAIQSIGVVLLQRILALLFGSRWWTFVIAFTYGTSVLLMPSLQWYSAGSHSLTETTLALASIHAYLCWWRGRRQAWLWWSAAAMVGALLFSEKGVLIPVWLVLMRVLLLDADVPLRTSIRRVVGEWRVWALYAIPLAVYLVVYTTRDYTGHWHVPDLSVVWEYLWRGWLHGFTPGILGVRVTPGSDDLIRSAGVAACQIALAAAVVVSIVRRRSAWRAWAFLAVAFLLNAVVYLSGSTGGRTSRTRCATTLTWPSWPRSSFPVPSCDRRAPSPRPGWSTRAGRGRDAGPSRWRPPVSPFTWGWWRPATRRSRTRCRRPRPVGNGSGTSSAACATGRPGAPGRCCSTLTRPCGFSPSGCTPGSTGSPRSCRCSPPQPISEVRRNPTYRVSEAGSLRAVRFQPVFGGALADLRRQGLITVAATSTRWHGTEACIAPTRLGGGIEVVPRRPLVGHPWFLQTTYRTVGRAAIELQFDRGNGYLRGRDAALPGHERTTTAVTEIGVQFSGSPTVRRLRIVTPPPQPLCVSRLVVGWYESARVSGCATPTRWCRAACS